MKTFVLLTIGPLQGTAPRADDIDALAKSAGVDIEDRTWFGMPYWRFSSHRSGIALALHVAEIVPTLVRLTQLARRGAVAVPAQLGLVVYGSDNWDICFSGKQLRQFARLGIDLEVQHYYSNMNAE